MPQPTYYHALRAICQPVRTSEYPGSLDPMRRLLAEIGSPQTRFPSIVVAGSVGKGTACYRTAQLLQANHLSVGLYTSPHLHSFRERFVINGEMMSKETFCEGVEVVWGAARRLKGVYSTFELSTALGLWWFAQKKIDIAVLEVGIGGRFDAVNVVDNTLAVFTRIEGEHFAMLGGSLETIAWHKAGILRQGGQGISVKQSTIAFMALQKEADEKRARLHLNGGRSTRHEGSVLALAVWQNLLERGIIPRRRFKYFLESGDLPGRMEQTSFAGRSVLIDGAHTPSTAHRLRQFIDELYGPTQPIRLVIGILRDKAAREFLAALDTPRFRLVLTQAPGHRALSPADMLMIYKPEQAIVELVPDLNEALAGVHTMLEAVLVVSGSLRMAAAAREAFGLLDADALAESRATRAIFEGEDYLARLRQVSDVVAK